MEHKEFFENLKSSLENSLTGNNCKSVFGTTGTFCPYLGYFALDALDRKDWPNGIAENSVFLRFRIDNKEHKVELQRGGHIWLSPSDKEREKYKYLCMRGMVDIAEEKGVKKFRKQGYKSIEDLTSKMVSYYTRVLEKVSEYTGGYPYKQGI